MAQKTVMRVITVTLGSSGNPGFTVHIEDTEYTGQAVSAGVAPFRSPQLHHTREEAVAALGEIVESSIEQGFGMLEAE
jgi:hypothetical protein